MNTISNNIGSLAVVVPVFNRKDTTLDFLHQIHRIDSNGTELEVIIVDDGSTDGTAQAIKEKYKNVTVLKGDGNLWWTGAINAGVHYVMDNLKDCRAVLIINDDLRLDEKFLVNLLRVSDKYNKALVSSVTINSDTDSDEVLTAGFVREGPWLNIRPLRAGESYSDDWGDVIECDLLTGASLLIPTSVISDIGYFDENNFPHNWGDFEYTLRAKVRGHQCLVALKSKVYTEFNPNYPILYYYRSTRFDYCKNMFNNYKFFYGFRSIRKTSFMHIPFGTGLKIYTRRTLALLMRVFLKIVLPKKILKIHVLRNAKKIGAAKSVVDFVEAN